MEKGKLTVTVENTETGEKQTFPEVHGVFVFRDDDDGGSLWAACWNCVVSHFAEKATREFCRFAREHSGTVGLRQMVRMITLQLCKALYLPDDEAES